MYVCICNPFTDTDVRNHLDTVTHSARVKEVYTACSGGKEMNCKICACELKAMVDTHNNARTIEDISQNMNKVTEKNKETV